MTALKILSFILVTAVVVLGQAPTQTNGIGMELVLVQPGSFTMGAFQPQCAAVGAGDNVTEAQHEECLKLAKAAARAGFKAVVAKPFYIGKYEVTQEQYQKVVGRNPSYYTQAVIGSATDKYPVDSVSWADTQAFLKRLNAMEKGKNYRLPTEAEWEYAARAGTEGETQGGKIQDLSWFMSNAGYVTHPVGTKSPNPWGLYDMLGNVWEWVQDYYDYDTVPKGPRGPSSGTEHGLKGGGFQAHSKNIRVLVHAGGPGSVVSSGFRVVMDAR